MEMGHASRQGSELLQEPACPTTEDVLSPIPFFALPHPPPCLFFSSPFQPALLCPLIHLWFFPSEPPLVPGPSKKKQQNNHNKNGRLVISDPQLRESRPPRQSAQSSSGFVRFASHRGSISGNVVPFIASKEKNFGAAFSFL